MFPHFHQVYHIYLFYTQKQMALLRLFKSDFTDDITFFLLHQLLNLSTYVSL